MWVYVDGVGVYNVKANQLDTYINVATGTHTIMVKAWDSSGTVVRSSVSVTVSSGSGGGSPCPLSPTNPSVTICLPAASSTVASPFRVYAGTTSSKSVTGMWAYLDGAAVYNVKANKIDTTLSAAAGTHTLLVKAWDSSGAVFRNSISFTVSSGTAPSPLTFSPSALSFADQIVGSTSVSQRVDVKNVSNSSVPISSIQIIGSDFSQLQNCGVQLDPGRSCEINVRFDPTIGGVRSATLQVSYTGTGGPKNIALNGNALAQAKPLIPINHIIWMMQENRDFESYFGKLNDYRASLGLPTNVDGIPAAGFTNKDPGGTPVASFHFQTMCIENVTPSWNESHHDVNWHNASADIGLMDGFVNQAAGYAVGNGHFDTRGVRAMGYYTAADLPYHYFMATNFATSDRWFSPLPASTPPNRLYALAASSFGTTKPPTTTFSQPNIFQVLENAGISWKIYYTDTDSNGQGLSRIWSFQPFAPQHADKIVPMSQYFTDLQNGTLPQVALLESGYGSGRDEHPGGTINGQPNTGNHVQVGAAYAASLINALMKSTSWKDSVLFFTFDEGGGFFDHVVPPFNAVHPDGITPTDLTSSSVPGDFTRYGFRLPFYVVSPYAKKNYVSHTPADLTAILKFIEERFNLPSLTKRDAAQPDLREFFDFNNPSWMTPPTPPTQPTIGPCDYTNIPE
jgi:phospholipase C